MVDVTSSLKIDDSELKFSFIRAAGPGGQNVNKVATAVQLRFDVESSPSLTTEVKQRLARLAAGRLSDEGVLIIEAKRYRTQEQNRSDAIQRLITMIQKALETPKIRRATKPTLASKSERLQSKRRRSEVKKLRGEFPGE